MAVRLGAGCEREGVQRTLTARGGLHHIAEGAANHDQGHEAGICDLVWQVQRPEQVKCEERAREQIVEVFVIVDVDCKADVAVEMRADAAPVSKCGDEVDENAQNLLLPVAYKVVGVTIGALEAEELGHEDHRRAKKAEKAHPVGGDNDAVCERVADLGIRCVATNAILPILGGEILCSASRCEQVPSVEACVHDLAGHRVRKHAGPISGAFCAECLCRASFFVRPWRVTCAGVRVS